jgi:nucleoside-triphosphatase THEP1
LLESVINELIEKQVTPIYLDEVGVLEIMGGGYHNILKKVLVSGLDLVIAVREDLVKPVTTHFAISDYELIKVPGEE